ncbi:MAG: hypothetical protein ABEI98_07775 [Halorhabdus sp.]
MRRRQYLGALAALGLAGCSGSGEDTTPTATSTATPPDTATTTPTDTPTDTPTETPTPDRGAAARPHVRQARRTLSEAYAGYVSQGDSEALTGVTAATQSFEMQPVTEHFEAFDRAVREARASGPTDAQAAVIDDLVAVKNFLADAATVQNDVGTAHTRLDAVPGSFFAQDMFDLRNNLDTAARFRSDGATVLAERTNQFDPAAADAFPPTSPDALRAKIEQFRQELATVQAIVHGFRPAMGAVDSFAEGNDRYDMERYSVANNSYTEAASGFNEAVLPFSDLEPPSAFTDQTEGMAGAMQALANGCETLAEAAESMASGRQAHDLEREAASEFAADSRVAGMDVVGNAPDGA